MRINWKVLIASGVIVAVILWAISGILPRSFSGTNLTFGVGNGTVRINNPSDMPIAVQLVATGSRSFSVISSMAGIAGSSTRQGSGSTSNQLLEYTLPPGTSDFTVTRGTGVNFISTSDTHLEALVQPSSEDEVRITLIVAVIIVVGGLYYISRSTEHQWFRNLRGSQTPSPGIAVLANIPLVKDPNRGRDGRMYSNYGNKD